MRTRVRGWRWRSSPLRRRSDVIEAWALVVVAVLLLLGAPLAGAATGWWAYGDAHATVAAQRAERHLVRAEVIAAPQRALPSIGTGTATDPYRATVRWTDAAGRPETTALRVPADVHRGDTVRVWLDRQDRSVGPPPDASIVVQHAITLGVCASGGTAAMVLLGWSAVRRITLAHRLSEWERDWARTEPEWTRRWA
ncbi:hypothetical protein ACFXAZ_14180 [Streptomyces sp. NPDC059477]|uniref:Rv1733c family protein n=1 Tax=Streptomyces sp. NPDC059477 TaxID=3346847 RepID=UPI0036B35F90